MSTKRKQIRAAIVEALVDNTDADDRVYPNRVLPLHETELPAILVKTPSEAVSIYAVASPIEYERRLQVQIEILADATALLDDVLDILGQQVEAALFEQVTHTLGELCHDVTLVSCETTLDKEGETQIGSLILTYEVVYHSVPARSTENLEWLTDVHTRYNLVEGASATDPSDFIDGLGDE